MSGFPLNLPRLLDVYAFFLEWCPAIHDGDTDDDEKSENEKDFVCSLDSDYSIVNISEADDEVLQQSSVIDPVSLQEES